MTSPRNLSDERRREANQEAALRRLQAKIPPECPLEARRLAPGTTIGGFAVNVLGESQGCSGRYAVVAAWIDGYLTSWKERV